ncbi:MAG: hypothetical protein QFF03_06395 [Pseudomonadota bacterium]|nr:hypothetical protein [Pseudomonadota bacterium]
MKKQIVRVSALQSAKVAAALYLVISVPMCLIMLIPMWLSKGPAPGVPMVMVLLMPVLYTVLGFVFTLVGAWIYNLVAARIGGFEFTTVEVGEG